MSKSSLTPTQADLDFDAEVGDEGADTKIWRVRKPEIAERFSKVALVLDLAALAISSTAAFAEIGATLIGGIAGGFEGAIAGALLGYAAYQPLNALENILGWASFGSVLLADVFSGNTLVSKAGGEWALYIGQDTLVAFASAVGGQVSEPLSDSVFNDAIVYYDIQRLFHDLPTSYNVKISSKGIQIGSYEEIYP